MAKVQNTNRWESVGWLFWGIGFAILIGPLIYLVSRVVLTGTSLGTVAATGAVLAAITSGVITVVVNATLQWAARNRRAAERKASTERKKARK